MKKILLGTSAIVLAGAIASPAAAAEWSMRVHGYMEQHLGYGNTDDNETTNGDYDGIDLKEDSEIWFSPSITLDNGIKFSARIELEGRTQGDQIDETYMNISGSFGTIRLGEDDQVSYNISTTAPDVTSLNINSGSDTKFFGGTLLGAFTTTLPAVAADPAGISYYSPSLAGFQVGASYARDGNRATVQSQIDQDMPTSNVYETWAVAASYDNTFGNASVRISGGYATGEDHDGDDAESWGAGINVGFGGFTVGGSIAQWDSDSEFDGGHYVGYDNTTWDAGVSYETGPWGFSFTYLNQQDDESGADFDIDKFLLGVDYKLAKGVRVGAWGVYADASYARDGNRATVQGQIDQDASTSNVNETWAVAASYDNTFGDASVRISGGYATGSDADGDDIDSWGAGINVGFGGFTVGGSYANWDADRNFDGGHYHGYDNDTWDVGVSYETGPWGFSFTYINSKQDGWNTKFYEDEEALEAEDPFAVASGDMEIDKFMIGISYMLAQGVKLSAWGVYADAEWDGTVDDGEIASGDFDEDAIAIGTSIRLDF